MQPEYFSLVGHKEGARKIHVHLSAISAPGKSKQPSYKHRHHAEEAFYILEGKAIYDLNGRKIRVAPGRILFFPAGMRHGIESIQSRTLKYLVIRTIEKHDEPCCCGKDRPLSKRK